MIINIILLVIIVLSLGGILFIIGRRFFLLSHIDATQAPEQGFMGIRTLLRKNLDFQLKQVLLKKKINHQARDLVNKAKSFEKYFKKVIQYLIDFSQELGRRLARLNWKSRFLQCKVFIFKGLDFFKKLVKIARKYMPR